MYILIYLALMQPWNKHYTYKQLLLEAIILEQILQKTDLVITNLQVWSFENEFNSVYNTFWNLC